MGHGDAMYVGTTAHCGAYRSPSITRFSPARSPFKTGESLLKAESKAQLHGEIPQLGLSF